MTQPSPTLTPVVGAPSTITRRAQLTGIITYDGPYQGGSVGAGLGSVPIAWDATLGGGAGGWRNTNTNAALTLPLARADVTGASAPTGQLVIDLTWVDESGVRQSDQLRMKPIAGADGVLDLTRDQTPTAVVATPDLVTAVQQAAQIPAKIQQVDTAVAAIPGQVAAGLAPVAPALAGIAQSIQQSQTEVDRLRVINNVGDADIALLLRQWAQAEAYEPTAITRNSDGLVTTATVTWPDGSGGTLTATNYNATHSVYDGYTITHASGKTVTQAAVTRDSNGAVTVKPALTVTP